MNIKINNLFVKVDRFCDYIPAVSSISNLTDLFQKCVVVPNLSSVTVENSRYFTHLQKKSFLRCFVLLIPILGNIAVGIYDKVRSDKDEESLLKNQTAHEDLYSRFKDNEKKVLEAIKQNPKNIRDADPKLRDDAHFMLAAMQMHPITIWSASKRLKNDSSFMLKAMDISEEAIFPIGLALIHNRDFMIEVIKKFPEKVQYVGEGLQESENFMLE